MELDDLIELFITYGVKAYKILYRNTPEGRRLDRHEIVVIYDVEFSCWRELSVYMMAKYLRELLPRIPVKNIVVNLDGNNSGIELQLTEKQYDKVKDVLTNFLKNENLL